MTRSIKIKGGMMSSNKRAAITIIGIAFFLFSFFNLVPMIAYGSNEQAQKENKEAPSPFNVVPMIAYGSNEQAQKEDKEAPSPEISEQPVIIGDAKLYTLGNEDILQITVRNQPEFSGQFVIGPDGKIQYTFVGDIEAAGLTKDQLKQRLIKELDRFVKVPEISIAISAYKSKNIYVLGEVTRPGQYPMKGDNISLRDAIIAAGLHTREAALRRVYIIKIDEKKVISKKVDLFALLYRGSMKYNLNLVPGDIVVVPSTIPCELNRALNTLLQPVFNAAAVDALFYRDRK